MYSCDWFLTSIRNTSYQTAAADFFVNIYCMIVMKRYLFPNVYFQIGAVFIVTAIFLAIWTLIATNEARRFEEYGQIIQGTVLRKTVENIPTKKSDKEPD